MTITWLDRLEAQLNVLTILKSELPHNCKDYSCPAEISRLNYNRPISAVINDPIWACAECAALDKNVPASVIDDPRSCPCNRYNTPGIAEKALEIEIENLEFLIDRHKKAVHKAATTGEIVCTHCGKVDFLHKHCDPDELLDFGACWDCRFWLTKVLPARLDERVCVTSDYEHYRIGDEKSRYFRGFGGRTFYVTKLLTNKTTKVTNLWYQGKIEERFRYLFTPNCTINSEAPDNNAEIF